MNKIAALLPEKLKKDKRLLLIIIIGTAAIILLLMSELTGKEPKKDDVETTTAAKQTDVGEYADGLEARLTELVSSIDGAGETRIMITLENSAEQVYAENFNSENEASNSGGSETSVRSNSQGEYIILDTGDGENGLILKIIQPEVRGVAVVCEGAGSAEVRKNVTEAVSSVLGISSARVSVTKMAVE